jgi:tRNA(Ile)-lysidine synthase
MSVLSDLQHFIRRQRLIPAGSLVVVGVSGGPDSLALLHALRQLAPEHGWRLHAACLHHGLRAEAGAEALFVAEVATAWQVGCTVERADLRQIAAQPGVSVEEAARQARYAFLARVALRLQAAVVAVGHNADDQAETVLMHLLRGSGLAGLRGMLPATPLAGLRLPALPAHERPHPGDIQLVRPWLQTSHADILAYCQAHDLAPRFDASNTDTTLFRNHLRHQVLPLLRQSNPRLTEVLGRTAAALQGDYQVLTHYRRSLWRQIVQVEPGRVRFPLAAFRQLHRADQRAMVRRGLAALLPEHRDVGWAHSEHLLDILEDEPERASGGPYPLVAGVAAVLTYEWLELQVGHKESPQAGIAAPQVDAAIEMTPPQSVGLGPDWQLYITADTWTDHDPPPWQQPPDPNQIWFPLDTPLPLTVRPRRPGDRMRPLGLGGSKPITDLMTELKLPRPARPAWPLLVDARGDILWLVGKRADEGCRLPDGAGGAWQARLLPWEGKET